MKRRALAIGVTAFVLLASCTAVSPPDETTSGSTTAPAPSSTTTSPPAPVDLSGRPLVWFQPLPALADPSLPFADGSEDFYDLFAPGAPWTTAASRTQVFGIYSTYVRHYANDEQLRTVIEGVQRLGMALAMEVGPLPAPRDDSCIGAEGYGGVDELELVRRIKRLGGTLDVIALDEPYAFGHAANGPDDCQRPIERVAAEVADFVSAVRREMPEVVVGDIEPMWSRPEIGVSDMGAWFDAYSNAAGEDFSFIHLDAEWGRTDWPEIFAGVEREARARGIAVGVIYNGGDATSDEDWTDVAADRMFTYETLWGGAPDHVVIQSWNDHPHRVLPDTDPSTLTGLVNRYFGSRTVLTPGDLSSLEPGVLTLDASLQNSDGSPIGSAVVSVDATPTAGQPATVSANGTVPVDATEATIIIRVNTEGAGPGPADVRIYGFAYREGDTGDNLVTDPLFEHGLEGWNGYGDGSVTAVASDRGSGTMLRLTALESQPLWVDAVSTIPVTPGAEFQFSYTAGIPNDSAGSGYVALAFLDGGEIDRVISPLTPRPEHLGESTTDTSGRIEAVLDGLESGSYAVRITYAGDMSHWPSNVTKQIEIN